MKKILLTAILALLPLALFAQTSQSLAKIDQLASKIATDISPGLRDGKTVSIGTFLMNEAVTPFSGLLGDALLVALVEPSRRVRVLDRGPVQADFTVYGTMSIVGESLRISLRVQSNESRALAFGRNYDLAIEQDFRVLLQPVSVPSSSGVFQDSYEPDSRSNPLTLGNLNQAYERTLHDSSDEDWFLYRATQGGVFKAQTHGSIDTLMWVYSVEDGSQIIHDDDSGDDTNAMAQFLTVAGKSYLIRIKGYEGTSGAYSINFSIDSSVQLIQPRASRDQALEIRPGDRLSIAFDPNTAAENWFKFTVTGGNRRLNLFTEGSLDTFLEFYDANMNKIEEDDDSGSGYNAQITTNITRSGTYYIKVRELDNKSSLYTLIMTLDSISLFFFSVDL